MTMTIGLIGSGDLGSTLARLFVQAQFNVLVSNSRGPASLSALCASLGQAARGVTPEEAARGGDIVVVSTPLAAWSALPKEALVGKTVVDTMNYYPDRDGLVEPLANADMPSSVFVQQELSASLVVKCFNSVDFRRLGVRGRPPGAHDRSAIPLSADDEEAKVLVAGVADAIGYDTVDVGPLADSWRFEPGTPCYVYPYLGAAPDGLDQSAVQDWFMTDGGQSVSASRLRELLAAANPSTEVAPS